MCNRDAGHAQPFNRLIVLDCPSSLASSRSKNEDQRKRTCPRASREMAELRDSLSSHISGEHHALGRLRVALLVKNMKCPACRYVDSNRTVAPSTAPEKVAAGEEKSTPVQNTREAHAARLILPFATNNGGPALIINSCRKPY